MVDKGPRISTSLRRITQAAVALLAAPPILTALALVVTGLLHLVTIPPNTRSITSTIFVLAFAIIPSVAMAGCSALGLRLIFRVGDRSDRIALALFVVSLGNMISLSIFGTFMAANHQTNGPALPQISLGVLGDVIGGASLVLAPFGLLWFTSAYDTDSERPMRGEVERGLRWLLSPPFVLLPAGLAAMALVTYPLQTGAGLLVSAAVLLATRVSDSALARRRTWTLVAALMACVAGLAVAVPSMFVVPALTPWFQFDVAVLCVMSGVCGMVAILAHAVLVRGAVGPQPVIRRTLTVGLSGAAAIFAFAGFESVISDALIGLLHLPSQFATFITGGATALAITLFRHGAKRNEDTAVPSRVPRSADRSDS